MTTSTVSYKLGQSIIDLGRYGKLIAPVQVDGGKWYYFWDRSGDGTSISRGSLNGGSDKVTHVELDRLLSFDIKGIASPYKTTDDIFRFGTINGVNVALPAYGLDTTNSGARAVGTSIGAIAGDNTLNSRFDGLLAIWDAFNGSSTGLTYGTDTDGTPPGWQKGDYWSATPAGTGYMKVDLEDGYSFTSNYPSLDEFVALEVLPQTIITDKKETNQLTVIVKQGVLAIPPVILKNLLEEIVVTNAIVTSHTVTYGTTKFKYSEIDALISTITRNGEFTDEFKSEISDLVPSLSTISYESLVTLVGNINIDTILQNISGADGNYIE